MTRVLFSLLLIFSIHSSFAQVNYLDKGMGNGEAMKLGASVMDWIGTNTMDELWAYCDKNTKVDTVVLKTEASTISEEYQYESGKETASDLKENESTIGWYERTFYQQEKSGIKYLVQIKVGIRQFKEKQLITYIKFLKGTEIHSYNKDIKAGSSDENEPPPSRLSRKSDKDEDED